MALSQIKINAGCGCLWQITLLHLLLEQNFLDGKELKKYDEIDKPSTSGIC